MQLRELQDETGHFLAMTPLSFHPEGTQLAHLPHPSGDDDLRNIAVARLLLDNFPHIKSFWIMNTPAITQIALWYGADDVDGTVHEYEIVYQDDAPGVRQQVLTRRALIQLIRDAGRVPVERDSLYQIVHRPNDEPEEDPRDACCGWCEPIWYHGAWCNGRPCSRRFLTGWSGARRISRCSSARRC